MSSIGLYMLHVWLSRFPSHGFLEYLKNVQTLAGYEIQPLNLIVSLVVYWEYMKGRPSSGIRFSDSNLTNQRQVLGDTICACVPNCA